MAILATRFGLRPIRPTPASPHYPCLFPIPISGSSSTLPITLFLISPLVATLTHAPWAWGSPLPKTSHPHLRPALTPRPTFRAIPLACSVSSHATRNPFAFNKLPMNSFVFFDFRTLCLMNSSCARPQSLSFQSLPHSCHKTPGCTL
jgi:hypothetical protein